MENLYIIEKHYKRCLELFKVAKNTQDAELRQRYAYAGKMLTEALILRKNTWEDLGLTKIERVDQSTIKTKIIEMDKYVKSTERRTR
jgi:hypothetical protein